MSIWNAVALSKVGNDGAPSATRQGHRVGPSMPADSLSSDDFLELESEDCSQDGYVDLRVAGSKASKASSKGCGNGNDSSDGNGDLSDDCTGGPCASSSNGRRADNRQRKTERLQGALDLWDIVDGHAQPVPLPATNHCLLASSTFLLRRELCIFF